MIVEKKFIELYNSGKDDYYLGKEFQISERTVQNFSKQLRKEGKLRYRKELFCNTPIQKIKNNPSELLSVLKDNLSYNYSKDIPKKNKNKIGDTLIIDFTDWHVGRIVKNEENEIIYNEKIFQIRINTLIDEILSLLDDYINKGTKISDVIIISTGDILDGAGIFASQETMQEMSPPFQVMIAVRAIQRIILALLKRKLNINFYGVKGNHGEIRFEGKSKDPNTNWDLMLYLILDFWVKNNLKTNKIIIHYSELDYLNFKARGWNYHIRHIAPQQPETASGKAKFLGWARKHKSDVIVYGHYHHYSLSDKSGITVIRGGSMTGGDEYAETLAEENDPAQLIWGCNEKRPVTFFYSVDLGRKTKK